MKTFIMIVTILITNLFATTFTQATLQKKIYPIGKKIYNHKCHKITNFKKYKDIQDLQNNLKCKHIKSKQLQMVSLYLWDIKRVDTNNNLKDIKVTKKEKCPVCGMFVYKYPRWVAQIYFKHNNHIHHLSFDGVKDMMKFYFSPMQWGDYKNTKNIVSIEVTDYYTQHTIDAKKAYYVIRSDVYGPMGNELIPFKTLEDAKTFKLDHNGKTIITFDKITEDLPYKLDENE